MRKFDKIVESVLNEDASDLKRKAIAAVGKLLKDIDPDYDGFEASLDFDNGLSNAVWALEEYDDMVVNPWKIFDDPEFVKYLVNFVKKLHKKRGKDWHGDNWFWGLDGDNIPEKIKKKYRKQEGVAYTWKEALKMLVDSGKAQKMIDEMERNGQALFDKDSFEFELVFDGDWVRLILVSDGYKELGKARVHTNILNLFKKAMK
jgi:hypothetical protein